MIKLRCKIDELIREKGYRKGWVAEQCGVSRQQLGNWSRGTSFPTVPKLFALARLLGVKVDDLYEEANEKNARS